MGEPSDAADVSGFPGGNDDVGAVLRRGPPPYGVPGGRAGGPGQALEGLVAVAMM